MVLWRGGVGLTSVFLSPSVYHFYRVRIIVHDAGMVCVWVGGTSTCTT